MNDFFMKKAIEIAQNSNSDIPVGAVIVKNEKIISSACNEKEKNNDVSAHAEIVAIRNAEKVLNDWRLNDCEIYVTLEPCPMCAWAIIQSGIKAVYFGSFDTNYGAIESKVDLKSVANSKIKTYGGVLQDECDKMLKDYFIKLRK